MSRLKRVCLVLLAFVLLPLGPAHAEPKNEIYWSGTVINKIISRSQVENPADLAHNYGGYTFQKYENYVRNITAFGNGYAAETVSYSFRTTYTRACNYILNPTWYGTETVTRDYFFHTDTKPFSVVKTDSFVVAGFQLTPVVAATKVVDTCTGATTSGTMPIQTQALLTLTSEYGEFSESSTEIWGYQPGYNDYLPAGPPTATTGWQFNSYNTFYNLSGKEVDTPYFSQNTKDIMSDVSHKWSIIGYSTLAAGVGLCITFVGCVLGGPIGITGSLTRGAAFELGRLAKDPPDPNYTEIALPVTPTISQQPIVANGDLSQVQASALNALIETDEQIIGLERAILTSFNRASGAQLANDSYWFEQQLQTARTYSGQLADLVEARQQLSEDLKLAIQTYPGLPLDITAEDLAHYQYDLLTTGLPTEQEQLLIELDVDERGRAEILFSMILAELPQEASLQDPLARFPDLLIDVELIQATQDLANSLREFAEGAGLKIYLPIVTN